MLGLTVLYLFIYFSTRYCLRYVYSFDIGMLYIFLACLLSKQSRNYMACSGSPGRLYWLSKGQFQETLMPTAWEMPYTIQSGLYSFCCVFFFFLNIGSIWLTASKSLMSLAYWSLWRRIFVSHLSAVDRTSSNKTLCTDIFKLWSVG